MNKLKKIVLQSIIILICVNIIGENGERKIYFKVSDEENKNSYEIVAIEKVK